MKRKLASTALIAALAVSSQFGYAWWWWPLPTPPIFNEGYW